MQTSELYAFLTYTVFGLAVLKWLQWKWSNRHLYRFMSKFAGPKRLFTVWHLRTLKYKRNLLRFAADAFQEFKANTVCGWVGPMPLFSTIEPELIEKICTLPDLQHKSVAYNPVKKYFQGGLAFISGREWQHHRKVFNSSFQNSLLLKFISNFNRAKNIAVSEMNGLADGSEQNLEHLMLYMSVTTALDTNFEKQIPKTEVLEFCDQFNYFMKECEWKALLELMKLKCLTIFDKKFHSVSASIRDTLKEIVREKQSSSVANEVVPVSEKQEDSFETIKKPPKIFVKQLIDLHKTNELSFNDVITESVMLIIAASETTGLTMFSVLIMLAMHPEVQERVFEEVESVFPDKEFDMEYEHIQQLRYLDMVINETMRLVPVVPYIGRDVIKDTPLTKDITLPKGLQIFIPIYLLQRRKDIWGPDANEFNPDHFLPENFSKIHPYAFMPFSKGARNCVGWRYAGIMLKIVLAGLIRNFKYETDWKLNDLQFENGISIRYKVQPLLKIHRRP